jgi:lipopolysaccharide exporter
MSSKKSYWVVSGIYSIGSRFSTLLFGFGGFYLLVRSLPQTEFGTWALFLTLTTIIEMSRNGLIQNALIKFLHATPEDQHNEVVTASWILNLIYSVIIMVVLLVLSVPLARVFEVPQFSEMFLWYSATLLVLVPFSQFNYLQQARFSFGGIFWSTLARQGCFFLVILTHHILNIQLSIMELVVFQLICTIAGLIVAFFCARKYLIHTWSYSKVMVAKVFHFGKYVMGTNMLSLVYKSTDQILIGYYLNTTSVAIYNSAIRISNLIEYPATSVAEVVYPKTTQMYEKDKDEASRYFYEKAVGLTMTVTLPIVIFSILFAEWIIEIIAGAAYAQSADILRLTILFGLFTPFSRQFGTAMDSSGRPQINFMILCLSVVVNVICNVLGILHFGIMGAAYGTLISYGIMGVICYLLMVKIFRVSFLNTFVNMFQFYQLGFSKFVSVLKR